VGIAVIRVALLALWLAVVALGTDGLAASQSPAAVSQRVTSGSGFFVSPDGDLVTSAHVIAGCPAISVFGPDGVQRPGTVVGIDDVSDIALLSVPGAKADYIKGPTLTQPPVGTKVLTLGYGVYVTSPRKPSSASGTLLGSGTLPSGSGALVIDAQLKQGQSGGPMISLDGALVGMVEGRYSDYPGRGLILPAIDIEAFLGRMGQRLQSAGPASKKFDSQEFLRNITALVQCLPAPDQIFTPKGGRR
jgi:S1-C subfamily serine protease